MRKNLTADKKKREQEKARERNGEQERGREKGMQEKKRKGDTGTADKKGGQIRRKGRKRSK